MESFKRSFNTNGLSGEDAMRGVSARTSDNIPNSFQEKFEDDPFIDRYNMISNDSKKLVGEAELVIGEDNDSQEGGYNDNERENERDYRRPNSAGSQRSSNDSQKSAAFNQMPTSNIRQIIEEPKYSSDSDDYARLPSQQYEKNILPEVEQNPEELKKKMIQERRAKLRLLNKIERHAEKGVAIKGVFDIDTPLDDLELEVERLESKKEMDNAVTGYKDSIMFFTGLCELASKYFGVGKIDGYSEQVYGEMQGGKYEQVLEDLYEKHRDRPKMAPELRLLLMFGGGMFMYNMSNVMMPKQEIRGPQVQAQIQDPNIINRMRMEQMAQAGQQMQGMMQPPQMMQPPPMARPQPQPEPKHPQVVRKQMSGPQGVDDLLRNLQMAQTTPSQQLTEEEEDKSDTMSYTASEIASGNPKKKRREKKLSQVFNLDL